MHSSSPPITLPQFPEWVQQLAHILPLAVFVEFVDASLKLHAFQLNGLTPLWNWPITPKDARLLLSAEDTSAACHLDRATSPGHAPLHCIDGRHGDCYQSNAPTTVRLCASSLRVAKTVPNPSRTLLLDLDGIINASAAAAAEADDAAGTQKLDFVHVYPAAASSASSRVHRALFGHRQASMRYCFASMLGWLLWVALTCLAFLAGLYVGAVYLLLMPLSGVLAVLTNGGEPRGLSTSSPSHSSHSPSRGGGSGTGGGGGGGGGGPFSRLVLAADSLNSSEWWGFYGASAALDGLLRRPLRREAEGLLPGLSRPVRLALRAFVLGQWVLALVACVKRDWNAFVVAFWVFWCALATGGGGGVGSDFCLYSPAHGVEDWLKYSCNVRMRRVRAVFSSRKAMLGALVYLNPDTVGRRLQWVNHFFEDGPQRREWESALLDFIETGSCNDDDLRDQPCWAWIEEGVEMGKRIAAVLKQSEKGGCLPA